jgi:hypothetical protein
MWLCSPFESSGVLAAALDTATLPYRLHSATAPPDLGPARGAPPSLASFGVTLKDRCVHKTCIGAPHGSKIRCRLPVSDAPKVWAIEIPDVSSGAISMWDLAVLLTPAGRANLAAAGASLPAPPLPSDAHAAAASSDARTGAHPYGTDSMTVRFQYCLRDSCHFGLLMCRLRSRQSRQHLGLR